MKKEKKKKKKKTLDCDCVCVCAAIRLRLNFLCGSLPSPSLPFPSRQQQQQQQQVQVDSTSRLPAQPPRAHLKEKETRLDTTRLASSYHRQCLADFPSGRTYCTVRCCALLYVTLICFVCVCVCECTERCYGFNPVQCCCCCYSFHLRLIHLNINN